MSSIRARFVAQILRVLIRRRDWGPPESMVRRARRLFGTPRPLRRFNLAGVTVTPTEIHHPPGEWIVPSASTRRTILYLHGGGYVSCSPSTHRPITAALARLTPARVFASEYRLAPEFPYPAALDDAEAAYQWLINSGVSHHDIALAGDSAGGGLALALLLRIRDQGLALPSCAVLFSPATDLTGSGASVTVNDGKCAMLRSENIQAFARCYARPEEWREAGASPLFGRLDGIAPLHIQVGDTEILLDDAKRVHDKVQSSGGESELVVCAGVFHSWQMLDGFVPEARSSLQQAANFIATKIVLRES
ncbi:MAG: alpha/beta hydrolase [Cyanobacteria bacterium P01_D01_bin.156]